jgi:chemotaxis-related protein WspD
MAGTPSAPDEIPDCWNQIGIGGDRSCRELEQHIHCRNCPVYAAAGTQLLDRPLPAEYRREWSEHFAQAKKTAAPAKSSALVFRIGPEWLALPTIAFQEVGERRMIHSLPHRRQGLVLGLVNVRGELLVCVSLGRLLGLEPNRPQDKSRTVHDRLLVAHWDGSRLVFAVDEVFGVCRFHEQELQEPPATVAKAALTYTQGVFAWRGHTVGYLNADSLFAALNRSLT